MTDLVALDRFAGALADYPKGGTTPLDHQRAIADAADEQWVIRAFTIRARLGAYYPHSSLVERWMALYSDVEQLWADEQINYQDVLASGETSTRYDEFKNREWPIIDRTQAVSKLVLRS